nr:MAG: RNA-dependent RNA polymerase [Wufeng shrew phenuivirus 7]
MDVFEEEELTDHPVEQILDDDEAYSNIDLINDFIDAANEAYDIDNFPQPGLKCKRESIIMEPSRYIDNTDINIMVREIDDQLEWEIDLPDHLEGSTSVSSGKRTISRLKKYKLRHEYVAESLVVGETDCPLSTYFPNIGDGNDKLTPDVILIDGKGNIHVIEIATSRANMVNIGRRVLEEKLFKYYDALDARSHDVLVTYTAIVVTPKHVVSNIKLPIRLINDMSDRMHIAILLENEAESIGIKIQQEVSESMRSIYESVIREELGKVNRETQTKGNRTLMISDDFITEACKDPDIEEVKKCFAVSRMRTVQKMQKCRNSDHSIKIKEYVDGLKKGDKKRFRNDQKPLCGFPLVNSKPTKDTQVPERHVFSLDKDQSVLSTLWTEALSRMCVSGGVKEENKSALRTEALETDKIKIKKLEKSRKDKRKSYHRVELKTVLSTRVKKIVSKDGLFAKSERTNPSIISRKNQQKAQFSWTTLTNDIDVFLNDTKLLDPSEYSNDPSQDNIIDLISLAHKLSENTEENINQLEKWVNTKLFQSLDLISNIAFELAIAAKQNTKMSEFIVKKLRFHNAYIMIKPTNSKSHLFYSLFFPGMKKKDVLCDSPFRKLWVTSRGMVSDFCSIRLDKIENQASLSSCFLSLVSFWSDFHGLDDMSPNNFKMNLSALRMLLFSVLVRIEDKAETEESITLVRYMYMEIFKSNWTYMKPDPFKVLSKFTQNPRSRLNLWTIKKIIEGFSIMCENVPKRAKLAEEIVLEEGEDALPGDEWVGLLNVFNLSNINTATAAVNLMYIGYLKNKNQTPQANSDWNMLKKIMEEEFAVKQDPDSVKKMGGGLTSEDKPSKKEFSLNCISYGVGIMERKMQSRRGNNWKKLLGEEIYRKLSEHLSHEIATLKASSTCNLNDTTKKVKLDDSDHITRIKVIEAISSKLRLFDLNPFINFNKFINLIRDSAQGVIADLFQKNQHGGLREIYVLEITSRIIQLFIETISRTICNYFDEETLTHPSNKLKLLDMHKTRSYKISSKKSTFYFDLCSSSDKTRWNQNFQIRALSIPLFRMTPSEFHPAIKSCLNFWCNKKIKIPPAVCTLLINNVPLSCPVYTELKSKFLNMKKKWINKLGIESEKCSYVTLSTGMMQGILHFTSSLLHLSFLHAGKSLTLSFLRYVNPEVQAFMTQVCSSDDSATILTIHSEVDMATMKPLHTAMFYEAEIMLYTLTEFCKYFCMLESVKSTTALPDYVEFNSEFLFKNTIAIPTIKYVTASVNLTESESMMDRFYTFYNLVSDLYSTGFPAIKTSFCQIAQAHLHYKTMGSYTNGLFSEYIQNLQELPNPVYGFFLMDTELFPGVLGFQFSRWLSIQNCQLLRSAVQIINYGELESNGDGSIQESLTIKHGDSKRWKKLLHCIQVSNPNSYNDKRYKPINMKDTDQMEKLHNERVKIVEENYPLMYRHPKDLNELKIKLMIKASMPGVAKSLSKGVPFIQAIQMSMYAINTHAFTATKFDIVHDGKTNTYIRKKSSNKLSLLLALKSKIELCRSDVLEPENYEKMVSLMFPMQERYKEAYDVIRTYKNRTEAQTHRMRHRKNFILIQPKTQSLPLSLLQVVGSLWFGFTVKTSNNIYKRCVESYKVIYPWIKDDIHETLSGSPFSTMIELYSFISSERDKLRKFSRNGPSVQSNRFIGQLHQLIRKSFRRNTIVMSSEKTPSRYQKRDNFKSKISLALTIPIKMIRDKKTGELMSSLARQHHLIDDLPYMNKRNKILSLISLYYEGRLSNETLTDNIRLLQTGFLMSYTNPQKFVIDNDVKRWCGKGSCIFESDGLFFKFHLEDDCVTMIETNSWSKLRMNPEQLKEAMRKTKSHCDIHKVQLTDCISRFDGSSYQSPSGRGIPIRENADYERIAFDVENYTVSIRAESIAICTKIRGDEIEVLEYKTSIRDLNLSPTSYTGSDSMWDYWIEQASMPIDVAMRELDGIETYLKRSNTSERDKSSLSNWVKSTLSSRTKYLGAGHVIHSQVLSAIAETVLEEDWTEDEFADWYEEIGGVSVDEEVVLMICDKEKEHATNYLKEKHGIEQYEDATFTEEELADAFREILEPEALESPIAMIFSNWTTSTNIGETTIINKDTFSYLFMHPLWDNFINETLNIDQTFFNKVLQGVVPVVDSELGTKLMRIMKIKEKQKELNITQRFSRIKKGKVVDWWEDEGGASTSHQD